jgi:hypothetical protein
MIAEKQTARSEMLFQRSCDERGYGCSRSAETGKQRVRSPDFSVLVNEKGIIVEVKETTANEAEARLWRETRSGNVVVHCHESGRRAHNRVRAAGSPVATACGRDTRWYLTRFTNQDDVLCT